MMRGKRAGADGQRNGSSALFAPADQLQNATRPRRIRTASPWIRKASGHESGSKARMQKSARDQRLIPERRGWAAVRREDLRQGH
jgi:hypothetical protein